MLARMDGSTSKLDPLDVFPRALRALESDEPGIMAVVAVFVRRCFMQSLHDIRRMNMK